jgi:hypothetical protein
MRWAGHVVRMGEERKVYKVLVGKSDGKRPLGRPSRRWEVGIRIDLREAGLGGGGLDSAVSGQRPVAGCCKCGDEPSGSCATELVNYSLLLTCGLAVRNTAKMHVYPRFKNCRPLRISYTHFYWRFVHSVYLICKNDKAVLKRNTTIKMSLIHSFSILMIQWTPPLPKIIRFD